MTLRDNLSQVPGLREMICRELGLPEETSSPADLIQVIAQLRREAKASSEALAKKREDLAIDLGLEASTPTWSDLRCQARKLRRRADRLAEAEEHLRHLHEAIHRLGISTEEED